MKRIVLLILALSLLLSLSACGAKPEPVYEGEYASQEAFLEAMAKGISNRLKNVDDEKQRTDEEIIEYYVQLVTYELDQIEAYEGLVFEDPLFNELAHGYISACKMQLVGAQNYKNFNLYNPLWSGGRTIREGVICELYSRYNLPITSEEASHYSASNGTVSYTISPSAGANGPNLSEDDFTIESKSCHKNEWGSYDIEFVIRNNSGYDLNTLGIGMDVYDKDYNALSTASSWCNAEVKDGKTAVVTGSSDLTGAKYIVVKEFYCRSDDFTNYWGDFAVSDEFSKEYTFVIK